MKTVGAYEAKTHLPELLSKVAKGESITITKRGRPIAKLVPADEQPERDVQTIIREFRAYSKDRAETVGGLLDREIREMIEEGRP